MSNNAKTSTMFTKLKGERSNWEDNWELCAQSTLPQIYLEDSVRMSGIEPEDLVIGDSIGAEGLSNFVSQILKVAFPTQGAFFRVDKQKGDTPNLDALSKSKQQDIFRQLEQEAMIALYRKGLHAQKSMLMGTLLCLGNVPFRVPKDPDGKIQVYDLNDVVIKRTRNGKISDFIIKEMIEYIFLSDSAKETLLSKGKRHYKDEDTVAFYTHISMTKDDKLSVSHMVDDTPLDTPLNFTPRHLSEYQVSDLGSKRGSHYAVGVVQQYIPDIHKANVYADTATDTAVAGSLVNWAVDPKCPIRPEEFANREQGQPFGADPNHIQPIMANVGSQLSITQAMYNDIVRKLQRVFLLPTAVQRDAERVTAQEIRIVAQRLEESHSGLYAMIAENLQRPLAHLGLDAINDEELNMYKHEVQVSIVTAMEAQSRGMELDNTLAFLGDTTVLNSVPPQVMEQLKLDELLSTMAGGRSVPSTDLVKSPEELQQERQAQADLEQGQQEQMQAQQPQQSQVFQGDTGLVEDIRQPLI